MRDVRGGVLAVATGNLAKRPTNLLLSKILFCLSVFLY